MGSTHCAITAFHNGDPDIARDPLSTNRRLADSVGLQMFGTMVVAGPTPDVIYVLIPDSTTSTADDISPPTCRWTKLGSCFTSRCATTRYGQH